MPYEKPPVTPDEVNKLVTRIFNTNIQDLIKNGEGQIAQTFSFRIGEKSYYIQFNDLNMSQGGVTELFFQERFRQNRIPTRKIVKNERYGEYGFLITEKARGVPFHQLPEEEQLRCLPSVFDVLLNISRVDIDDTGGYGWLDEGCHGRFSTWAEHMLQINKEEPGFFYGNWHELFEKTFLERSVFERYYARMSELLSTIVEARHLVHGGLGYGNTLVDNGKVSAILDWQDARYGDPLFDLAYILFWRPKDLQKRMIEFFSEHVGQKGYPIGNIQNRLSCYKYYMGLDGLRFFSKTSNLDAYNATKSVMEAIESDCGDREWRNKTETKRAT